MYSRAGGVGEQQAPGQFRATCSERTGVQAQDRKGYSCGEKQENLQREKWLVKVVD